MGGIGWLFSAVAQLAVLAGLISMFCESYVLADTRHPSLSIAVLCVLYAPLAFAQWRMFRTELPVKVWLRLTLLTGLITFLSVLIVIQISFEMAHFPMKEVVEQAVQEGVTDGCIHQWYKDTVTKRKAERKLVVLVLLISVVLYGTAVPYVGLRMRPERKE